MHPSAPHFSRRLLAFFATSLFALNASAAWPDDQPIRIIVPQVAGGTNDTVARLISTELGRALKQSVVVANMPGAAGAIGLQATTQAKPDGYTLAIASDASILVDVLRPNLPWKFQRDLAPVAYIGEQPISVAVSAKSPYKSFADVLEASKSVKTAISYGTSGVGTPQHVVGEWLAKSAGMHLVHIPYKGGGQATADLVGGQVNLAVLGLAPMLAQHRNGGVRIVAVTSKSRNAALPNVPTLAELGFPQLVVSQWVGVVAPRGTPAAIINRLSDELAKVTALPQVQRLLNEAGVEPRPLGHAQFAEFLKENFATWARVVPTLNLETN
jgi:tripartite-type tricarboxylate transporter receptor subunit TctC